MFAGADLERFEPDAIKGLTDERIQSMCCVPLITQRGTLGTLTVGRRTADGFTDSEVSRLGDVAGQVAIAAANTLAYQQVSALKDRLTEEKLYLEDEISLQHDFKQIVGTSHALTSVLRQIRTVAPTDATVLLLGETGTGKELLARALHDASRRRAQTFVRVNGAALPSSLIESELFGYEKGAFTGATSSKVGRFELAHRGTLFLDEVGEIPLDVQPKLLRALQEQEFERLGSTRTQKVDVRLIAATNRDLNDMVAGGTFRSDLYYRLNVFPIFVPPLRERAEDIPPLVTRFTRKFAREIGREIDTIPAATMEALQKWPWPGNIRELENVIERAVILSTGTTLQVPSSAFQGPTPAVRAPGASLPAASIPAPAAESAYRDGERDMILKALRDARGVIAGPSGAAARLGLKRTTLHSKMRKLGIERPPF
jgi:formate hydrogenlyase transcriptional activator